jgi:nitrogen PTS system EIIA component
MNLTSLLTPDAVLPHLDALTKKQALKMMAARAAELTGLAEREVYSVLMAREQLGCTGMGNGVCVPHGRFEDLKSIRAIFASLAKPIEFGAVDGRPVDLLFLLLTPAEANTEHLKALAMISRLLRDKELCERLRSTGDPSRVYTMLTAAREDAA